MILVGSLKSDSASTLVLFHVYQFPHGKEIEYSYSAAYSQSIIYSSQYPRQRFKAICDSRSGDGGSNRSNTSLHGSINSTLQLALCVYRVPLKNAYGTIAEVSAALHIAHTSFSLPSSFSLRIKFEAQSECGLRAN